MPPQIASLKGSGGFGAQTNQPLSREITNKRKAAEEVAKLKPGSADFEFMPTEKLFVIPQMQQGEIVEYKADL